MAERTLRLGILGVAAINDRVLPSFRKSRLVVVHGIASRSADKSRMYANANDIPRHYGGYDALLADPDIDAVYIPLPNNMHAEWAMLAAEAGKHVLCEKPLAPSAELAEIVVTHCRMAGVRLMDGFMWPHHDRTRKLREFLDAGGIGDVRRVAAAFTFDLHGLPVTNIRLQPQAGGGGLLDVGCYCVYAIRWAIGAEPVGVFSRADYANGVDVALSGMLTFPGGRVASFDCGFNLPLRTWVEIVGTTGVVRVPNLWIPDERAAYEVIRPSGPFGHAVEIVETPRCDQVLRMIDEFASAILENREPNPGPNEAVKTLRVLDAVAKSARENREATV